MKKRRTHWSLIVASQLAAILANSALAGPICVQVTIDQQDHICLRGTVDPSLPYYEPGHLNYDFYGDLITDRTRLQLQRRVQAQEHRGVFEIGIDYQLLYRLELNSGRTTFYHRMHAIDLRQYLADDDNRYLPSPLENPREAILDSQVDLHTHFSGANRPESLLRAAEQYPIDYPANLLTEIGINISGMRSSTGPGGIRLVRLDPHQLTPNDRRRLLQALCIPPGEIATFDRLEAAYRFRDPIVRNPALMEYLLHEIARDYAQNRVRYAELSVSARMISSPELLTRLAPILRRIENDTGVRLRFLASLQRSLSPDAMARIADQVLSVANNYLIAGVDFVGEERNSVTEFSQTIQRFSAFRLGARPEFQIRVHAGESPHFPENVRLAVEAGATRIGHGLYGIDESVMELLRSRGIIVEMNLSSNIALGYLLQYDLGIERLAQYLKNGVPVVLGTDGAGVLSTDMRAEVHGAAQRLARDLQYRIFDTSQTYYNKAVNFCSDQFSRIHKFFPMAAE